MLTYHIKPESEQKRLLLLDQRLLPVQEQYFICRRAEDAVYAIREMVVRGAPAIGVTAAWACWLAALQLQMDGLDKSRYWERLLMESLQKIAQARPTAVNLAWAVSRMRKVWMDNSPVALETLIRLWENEAENIHADDIELNMRMGAHGAELITDGDTVMTHCNAGSLATAGYGTALGVIYAAVEAGKKIKVISNETRPWLQGARLTAFELQKSGVDVTVACDNSCAILMSKGLVQKVVVGADRVAANGDAANKIGTFGVAVLAKHFGIPFYIAAPYSTFDFNCPSGKEIPIEERPQEEVTRFRGQQIAPVGVPAYNFSFDVTPAALITGFITEHGVFKPPYFRSFRKLQSRELQSGLASPLEEAVEASGKIGRGIFAANSASAEWPRLDETDQSGVPGMEYPIGAPVSVSSAWLEDSAAEVAAINGDTQSGAEVHNAEESAPAEPIEENIDPESVPISDQEPERPVTVPTPAMPRSAPQSSPNEALLDDMLESLSLEEIDIENGDGE